MGLVKFNWVELFTLRRLMDSMQILPRTLLTKLGKSKPNMLYTALRSRVASRGILAASIVGETPIFLFSFKKRRNPLQSCSFLHVPSLFLWVKLVVDSVYVYFVYI